MDMQGAAEASEHERGASAQKQIDRSYAAGRDRACDVARHEKCVSEGRAVKKLLPERRASRNVHTVHETQD